jgi:transcriptional regulator with XRE-family HTH domain
LASEKRTDPTTLGSRIRKAREKKGLKQQDLAQRAGISMGFLSEIENDHRNPSGRVLLKLAGALGTTMDYLQTGRNAAPVRARSSVSIPPALAEAAERAGLSYAATATLAEAYEQIVARRGTQPEQTPTPQDWLDMYHALRRYLGE